MKKAIFLTVLLVAALFVFTACSTVAVVGDISYANIADMKFGGTFAVKVPDDAEYINYDVLLYSGDELVETVHFEKEELGSKDDDGFRSVYLSVFPDDIDNITNLEIKNVEVWAVNGPSIAFAVSTAAAAVATAVIIAVAAAISRKSR